MENKKISYKYLYIFFSFLIFVHASNTSDANAEVTSCTLYNSHYTLIADINIDKKREVCILSPKFQESQEQPKNNRYSNRILVYTKNNKIQFINDFAILNYINYQFDPFQYLKKTDNSIILSFEFGSILLYNYKFIFKAYKNKYILSSISINAFNKKNTDIWVDKTISIKEKITLKNFNAEKIIGRYTPTVPISLEELLKLLKDKQGIKFYDENFLKIFLELYPFSSKTLTSYNNIAYYLQKAGANKEAAYLLEKIIQKFPNRTVAYYNLGDAYWALAEKQKAIKAYTTYVEQMCHKGLQKKIPNVVLERVNHNK